jgi:hypothetical protein
MNEVESDGTPPPDAEPSPLEQALEQEYTQVNENFRRLADIRFRLLAFVPALGGVAVYVLATAGLAAEGTPRQPTNADLSLVVLIAAAGFFVTLGIVFYDQRNSELYNALIHRAKFLETESKLPRSPGARKEGNVTGQFNERPGSDRRLFGLKPFKMSHDTGLALIYGPVLGAWFFPLLLSALNLFGASSRTSFRYACIVAGIAGIVFFVELLRQDHADKIRWNIAGLIDTLAKDIRNPLAEDPPNENNLSEKVIGILGNEGKRSKIRFETVHSVQDRSRWRTDLLIVSKYIDGGNSFDGAVNDIAGNIAKKKDRKYLKRCHVLLLAYDSDQAIADDEKEQYKASSKLEGRGTVRIVSPQQ